jgi:hypothetical protein
MQCNIAKDNRRFGGIYRIRLRVQRVSQARNQHEAGNRLIYGSFNDDAEWYDY